MTDGAVPVTQSVVERFTEQYLQSIGCTIKQHGERWEITVPDEANTELSSGTSVLLCGDSTSELDENEEQLHPESSFFQWLITEASEQIPAGKITVDSETTKTRVPKWLRESNIEVENANFTPYYDRTAVVILYRISIETVSEYQTELLRTIALDARSKDVLSELEETFLEITSPDSEPIESEPFDLERTQTEQLVDHAREKVVERIQPKIDEIHQEASRAADAEVEEYRQLQQQRIEELEERVSNLSSKISELSGSIQQSTDQEERVKVLKKRKEVKLEHEEKESELESIRQQREQGFPEKQREIRDRHALKVVVEPLTITQVEYERGEIEIELVEETTTRTLTTGYGSGVGITEEVRCDSCNRPIGKSNPLRTVKEGFQCQKCTGMS